MVLLLLDTVALYQISGYCSQVPKRPTRRAYHSPRREEQARATRRSVLEAARTLFVSRGYVAATIPLIAIGAGVSEETVYALFGNKRSILAELIDVAIAGDDAPVPILDREWVVDLRAEPEASRRLRILARNGRAILERTADVYEVLRSAATVDPEIRKLWERTKADRLRGQREILRIVLRSRKATPRAAEDTIYALGSPETYRLLVVDRGLRPDEFERWYGDALERLLPRPRRR